MRRLRTLLLLLCLGILLPEMVAGAEPFSQDPTPKPPVSFWAIPFHPLKGLGIPVVHVRLNGRVETDFLVDTGSSVTFMRPGIADALGLKRKKTYAAEGSSIVKAGQAIPYVSVDSIKIGDSLEIDGDLIILDSLWAHFPKSIGGILGANAFASGNLAVLFYFEKQYLYVIPGGNLNNTQLQYMGMSGDSTRGINMTPMGGDGLFRVPVHVTAAQANAGSQSGDHNRWEMSLVLDTGCILTKASKEPSFPQGTPIGSATVFAPAGDKEVEVYPVTSFQVGIGGETASTLTHFACGFITPDAARTRGATALGLDFLSHFHVLIDYPARKLYMAPVQPNKGLLYPTETSRVNAQRTIEDMTIEPSAEGQWQVLEMTSKSPFARAGLQIGDLLEEVNGKPLQGRFPEEMVALLTGSSEIHLQITRGENHGVALPVTRGR